MGFYNVVKPCVVARRHHVRPTTQPIEVDDDTAAPLVESGCLEPYRPGGSEAVYERTEQDRQMGEGLAQLAEAMSGETAPLTDAPLSDSLGTDAGQAFAEAGQQAGTEFTEGVASESEPKPKSRRPRRSAED
jgi:hypothetical protein